MVPSRSTPAPDEGVFDSDGLRIHFRAWHPSATPRAVVVIVPGFNSHSAYYAWAAEQLVADRFAVYALDLRGRGHSDGERFYVDTFDDYVADVTRFVALVKSKEPAVPVFLLGHSAGGVVACLFAIDHQAELAGLICESFAYQVPGAGLCARRVQGTEPRRPARAHPASQERRLLARSAGGGGDGRRSAHRARDPADPTLAAMVRADERLKEDFPRITLPVLILHGTADKATKPSGSQFFYDSAGSSDKTLKLYDG